GRSEAPGDEDRAVPAAERSAALRVPAGRIERSRLSCRQSKDERGGQAAGIATGRDAADVCAGCEQAVERAAVGSEDTRALVDTKAADRVGDPGCDPDCDARTRRSRERKVARIDRGLCRGDHVCDGAVADALLQRVVVEDGPGTRAGLSGSRLDEVVLGPRDLALEELLPALVEHAREAAVKLCLRDEVRFDEVRV